MKSNFPVFSLVFFSIFLVLFSFVSLAHAAPDTHILPDHYIVVLNDSSDSDQDSADLSKKHGLALGHVYKNALKGFSAKIPAGKLDKVKTDPRVAFVSEDREVFASAQTSPTGIRRIGAPLNTANKGTGIGVAVIDTGIDLTHSDLSANIVASKNCIKPTRNGNDDNGHGSHVAGVIAARNNTVGVVGVAPEAKLASVKVLSSSGSGTWSSVICGIDWVTANASRYNIKVANMSLGGGGSSDHNCGNTNNDALHKAICRSVQTAGVTYVVAAGNEAANSTSSVPASYDDAVITVSALDDTDGLAGGLGVSNSYGNDDTFASFSNYGSPVDIAAPGVSIYSTYRSGGYRTLSGTSMATPHVAGAAALYLKSHPGSSWTQVRDALKAVAEPLGSDHTDPSGKHPEPVLKANSL